MHGTYHPPLFDVSSEHFTRWGWHNSLTQHWRSISVPFECSLSSARPSPLLTLLSMHCDVFVTNFTCTLPLSSYPYFYRSLLPAITSFVSSSKALPKHVSSQRDPNLFTANASLKDPQASLLCFPSAQNNHEISWVEAACPWTVAEHPVYCE